jgi:hypothetical protein
VRTISQQIPALIKKALESRKPIQIGPGTAIWNNVGVCDFLPRVLRDLPKAHSSPVPYSIANTRDP